VRGAWQLTSADGNNPHGLFTLIFRKFPDGWKIIHDHTSETGR
jgi:ketosteroid isomerase-like protein